MDESATSAWLVYWPKEKAWLPADAMAIKRVVPPSSAPKVSGAPPERPKAPPAAKSWPVMQCPEFSEPDEFWSVLGGQQAYPRARADEAPPAFAPRLFCCTDASGSFTVDELLDYSQRDLDHSDVFILDCWSAVFVWVGRNANEHADDECVICLQATPEGERATLHGAHWVCAPCREDMRSHRIEQCPICRHAV